jgi:Xaa-Pro aminopeptidase
LTDPRYTIQAQAEAAAKVRIVRGPLIAEAAREVARRRYRRVGFDSTHLSYASWELLDRELPAGTRLAAAPGLIENMRMVKSPSEIGLIRRSVETNSAAFDNARKKMRAGVSEKEIAAELDHQMRRLGAQGAAFETIVAAGVRSALPHAQPTETKVVNNQLLLIDMGASRDGYSSDMTRMLFLGKPPAKVRHLYDAVLEAQLAAIDSVRDGVTAGSVDRAARRVLQAKGYEKAFVHSTGHGLGLEIHEPPRIGKKDKTVLRGGMAITIEPGAYLEGFGGVRIEDTVLVTSSGCEVLTPTSKELIAL